MAMHGHAWAIVYFNFDLQIQIEAFFRKFFMIIFKMVFLENFKVLIVFSFEYHHFSILLKYFVPKIFKIILYIQFSLPELDQFTHPYLTIYGTFVRNQIYFGIYQIMNESKF